MPAFTYLNATVIPPFWGWTAYTPVIPKLYWDVYSQEERIKRLCIEYDKLTHYASMVAEEINNLTDGVNSTIKEFREEINTQLQEQNKTVSMQLEEQNKYIAKELQKLKNYVDEKLNEIALGTLTYDVTTGSYRPSAQSMRRLFQALSYDHKGNEQLVSNYAENYTVAELAEKTVYNAAYSDKDTIVINSQYKGIFFPNPNPEDEPDPENIAGIFDSELLSQAKITTGGFVVI